MTADDFAGFERTDFTASQQSPFKEAELLMKYLGFRKVKWNCVYEGPVKLLVEGLRSLGWVDDEERKGQNPYLLIHPMGYMTFNYAESETLASERFVAYFRG